MRKRAIFVLRACDAREESNDEREIYCSLLFDTFVAKLDRKVTIRTLNPNVITISRLGRGHPGRTGIMAADIG